MIGDLSRGLALLLVATSLGAQQRGADSAAAVDAVFAGWTGASTPGCAVGVARNGRVVLTRAYGMANLEYDVPITPTTIFEAGSVSKQFTAAAVVLLALDGRLSLEDPVRKYIPELPPYADSITIRQMLNHTSGLRDWGTVAAVGGWPRGTRTYTQRHVLDILAHQRSLNYRPGNEYLYSNSNYNLAAMIVERVSGQSLPAFTRARIFEPLGMRHTSWRDDYRRIVKHRATAYSGNGANGFEQDMPFENVYGNSSLLTTVEDLIRWNQNFVDPVVGGPRLIAELQTRGLLNSGDTISYALGLVVEPWRGVPSVTHTGSTAGYRAYLARFPEQRLDVALLCNSGAVSPGAIGGRVAEVFLRDQLRPVVRQASADTSRSVREPEWKPEAAELEQFTGRYTCDEAETWFTISVRDGRLVRADRYGQSSNLTPVRKDAFRQGGTRVTFIRDAAGRVVAMSLDLGRVRALRFERQ